VSDAAVHQKQANRYVLLEISAEEVRRALHCRRLDSKTELDTNVDVTRLLDDLGELYCLVGSLLQVVDGEDLETGVADL